MMGFSMSVSGGARRTGRTGQMGKRARAACLSFGLMLGATLGATLGAAQPASAQNLFAPAAYVNEDVVTKFEVDQRLKLLKVLGSVAATQEDALEALINERLQIAVASRFGVGASPAEVEAAMDEFAARGNLDTKAFLALIQKGDVAPETFRDFVTAGAIWRKFVRAKFGAQVTVSDDEVARVAALPARGGGLRILFSELFLPARDEAEKAKSEALAAQIMSRPTLSAFAAAAREYSVAPSRDTSGRQPWVDANNLPPALSQAFVDAKPGDIIGPLNTGNAIGLFQLRALAEYDVPRPRAVSVEYAAYYIGDALSGAAAAEAAKLRDRVDTCDDLYGLAKGQPEEVLERDSLPVSSVPQDVAIELAKLDVNEVSTALRRAGGDTLVFLMLCNRQFEDEQRDPAALRDALQAQKIAGLAESYLAELRASAAIRIP